jgi:hypothetical protein
MEQLNMQPTKMFGAVIFNTGPSLTDCIKSLLATLVFVAIELCRLTPSVVRPTWGPRSWAIGLVVLVVHIILDVIRTRQTSI